MTTGLEALARLPEGHPARKLELGFLLLLGPLYGAVEGESSTQAMAVYERALELADATEEPRTRFKIWDGAWRVFGNRSDLERAQDATRHMVAYAETTDDSAYRLHARNAVGTLCLYQGRHEDAVRYSEEALTYSNPERDRTLAFEVGRDPVANAFLNVAFCSMALGFVDRAQRAAHSAVHAARESRHPYTLTATLIYAGADTAHFVGNTLACRSFAEEGLSVARRYGFVQAGTLAALYMAWADTWTMPSLENAEALSAAFDDYRRTKAEIRLTRLSAVVADAYRRAGRPEAGLAIVEPWLRGERITHSEAPRVAGELRLAIDARDHKTAEELFGCALRVAREEGARYLELRAAASLARLWEKQGRRKEAYDLLAPIYNWFTEGFDTKDLKEAKVLLEELAA